MKTRSTAGDYVITGLKDNRICIVTRNVNSPAIHPRLQGNAVCRSESVWRGVITIDFGGDGSGGSGVQRSQRIGDRTRGLEVRGSALVGIPCGIHKINVVRTHASAS